MRSAVSSASFRSHIPRDSANSLQFNESRGILADVGGDDSSLGVVSSVIVIVVPNEKRDRLSSMVYAIEVGPSELKTCLLVISV